MDLELFVTRGVGDSSYLLASGREAVLVDPQRDAWRFTAAAEKRGWRIGAVLETHVHNDYLSGALEVRAATGAEIVAPARGRYEFEHRGADEGDRLELGEYEITALATPGHTPEHLSWLVTRGDEQLAAFTGGSLLVGAVGRTDLLGPALTNALTIDQQRSLRRLAELSDAVRILPTHGSGSFCSAGSASADRTTTLGVERRDNPTFRAIEDDEASFREALLGHAGLVPAYYAHMAAMNRQGPRILQGYRDPPALDPDAFGAKMRPGVTVVDARNRRAFADAHVPGSLNIELDDTFGAYVGWLVPFAAPLLLVLPEDEHGGLEEATTQLLRIGYERVHGWLEGGIEAWQASSRPTSTYEVVSIKDVSAASAPTRGDNTDGVILDVRQPIEWSDDGTIPGSQRIFVADLPARLAEVPTGAPVTVLCKAGSRAAIAASLLDGAGHDVRLVVDGGAPDWAGELERDRGGDGAQAGAGDGAQAGAGDAPLGGGTAPA